MLKYKRNQLPVKKPVKARPNFQGSKSFANGWFYKNEGDWYLNICNKTNNGNIVEIGSFEGLSLSYIRSTIKTNNNKIYSIEINCRPRLIKNAKEWGIELICKSSIEASQTFPDKFFDLIYIDGNHSYKSVKSDINAWFSKAKRNGIIAGHDYDWSGVRRAVNERFGKHIHLNGRNWFVFVRDLNSNPQLKFI